MSNNYNIFLIPIITLIFTRVVKFIIFYFRHNKNLAYTFKHAMSYGHMPSVHTALMISMITSVGYYVGVNSGAFAVAVVVAIIVIDDATRLRVYMGHHSEYINMIKDKVGIDNDKYPPLKERMGHRLSEVLAGAVIGFGLTIVLIFLMQ